MGKEFKPRMARNETPMYVRPYLEDPLWLEPDDDEIALLHDAQLAKEAAAKGEKPPAKTEHRHAAHHYLHDLTGDPDLENPQDDDDSDDYDDLDQYIVDDHHRNDML